MNETVVTQICVVVENVREISANWAEVLGVEPAEVVTIFPEGRLSHVTNGKAVEYVDLQVAKYTVGSMVLELIQPGATSSPWRTHLEQHGQGVFHFCVKIAERDAFLELLSGMGVAAPYHVGAWTGGSYSYAPSRDQLGVELSVNHSGDSSALLESLSRIAARAGANAEQPASPMMEMWKRYNERDRYSLLKTMDVETGEVVTLARLRKVIEAPNWTKDGKALIYNSSGRLYRYELASGETSEIPTGASVMCNNDHVLSSDGKSIAISDASNPDHCSKISILPIDGGEPVLITPKGPSYLHGWSPDGKTLAYCAERNGQYDIYTIPAGGGWETQLTFLPGLDDGPEYSPDGGHIWFNSTRSGLMQVWRMGEDGSNPRRMTESERNDWFPHVSPDGKKVVYISYRKEDVAPAEHPPDKQVEIRMMDSDGRNVRTLLELFGGQGTMNVNSWSPDSRRFAFVSYEMP